MADLDNLTLQDAFKTPDTAWPIELTLAGQLLYSRVAVKPKQSLLL